MYLLPVCVSHIHKLLLMKFQMKCVTAVTGWLCSCDLVTSFNLDGLSNCDHIINTFSLVYSSSGRYLANYNLIARQNL